MATAGKSASRIAEYISLQWKEDELGEQITMSELARLQAASNSILARLTDGITRCEVYRGNTTRSAGVFYWQLIATGRGKGNMLYL